MEYLKNSRNHNDEPITQRGESPAARESARSRTIVRTSIIGIAANLLLAGFKAAVGLLSNSIAIVLDAVNNLSDALSSVITIIGTKLAGKAPDRKHPLGHGRIEYLSAAIISMLVLYAGLTSLIESVKKILHPETPDYSTAALIIVAAAVVVKIALGLYVKRVGKAVNSESLEDSGADALNDSIISASTLAAAAIYLATHISLEAYLGVIISGVIIKAGVDMLRSTISKLLGERVEGELTREIKKTIQSMPDVSGAYDLILHSYGPEKLMGSVHIEIPDTMTADEIDRLERSIQGAVYEKYGVALTGIGIYSVNTKDDRAAQVRSEVMHIIASHDYILQVHGFYLDEEKKTISFDVIIDFAAPDRAAIFRDIVSKVQERFPEYTILPTMDIDISD